MNYPINKKKLARPSSRGRRTGLAIAAASIAAMGQATAYAFEIDTGNPDVQIHWDTQIKYTAAFRVEGRSGKMTRISNQDDGDNNFGKGLVSNRADLFTEFDAQYHGWGVRLSGAGWYDTVYNKSNDNISPATVNHGAPFNEFPRATRELHGRKAELLDAFVFGKFKVADSPLTFRAGRHALQWGETLVLGTNGIAGGMQPLDLVKLVSVPNVLFKELIRPVGQVSAQISLGSNVFLGAFYQYEWEPNVFPGAGSYFSTADVFDEGGMYFSPQTSIPRRDDDDARQQGQFGAQLRFQIPGWEPDFGIYGIHYHSKSPAGLSIAPAGPAPFYKYSYAEDITAVGASASQTFGDVGIAAEGSVRFNTPLASRANNVLASGVVGSPDNPTWAVGHTLHFNINALVTLAPNFISNEASVLAEVAYNHLQTITENPSALAVNAQRDGLALVLRYTPTYRQALPGLDISVPLGVTYAPMGNDAAGVFGTALGDDGGTASAGLSFVYLNSWRADIQYTRFFGPDGYQINPPTWHPATGIGQPTFDRTVADRDFVSISVSRTF